MEGRYVLLTGTALGAGLMYFLDPPSGKRRRAYMRDKMTHLARETDLVVGRTIRDLHNRYHGVLAEMTRSWTEPEPSDEVLVDRIHSVLGRVVSHPGAADVAAEQGWITLTGPILASDEKRLLRRVLAVRGVRGVQSKLEVHKSAAHISGLQGGEPREERAELMQTNWSPTARLLSILGGAAAALYGFRRRDAGGAAAALLGMGFLARGVANTGLRKLLRITPREPVELKIQKTAYVEAPVEKALSMWSDLHNLPRFLPGVQEVKDLGEGRSMWTMTVDEKPMHWESVFVASKNAVTWKSQRGSIFANSGTVRFDPAPAGARIQVTLSCRPSRGVPNRIAGHWFGPEPSRYLAESLAEMKRIVETEAPRAETQAPEKAAS